MNRVVETWYRLRDGTTSVLQRIRRGYQQSGDTAESTSNRIAAANRRQQTSLQGVLAKIGRMRFAYFAVAGAIAGVVRSVGGWVSAANQQEQAERRLEHALQNGRGATDDQIQALKDLASERQRVTRFGDEATISLQAQLATFRLTADQIATLTPRVQDLAEGNRKMGRSNVDLERSAQLVGRAMTGNIGALSRYGITLSDVERQTVRFGSETERLEVIAGAIDRSFGGMAEALTPFEGASRRTENAIGDFREQLGSFVTESTAVQDAVDSIGDAFNRMAERVAESGGTTNRVLDGLLATLRILGNTAKIIFQGIMVGANRLQRGILETGQSIAENLARITFGSAREALNKFVRDVDQELRELEQSQDARFDRMGAAVDGFLRAGEDLNESLFTTTQAQREANEASREAQAEAIKQRREEEKKQDALERTRETLEQLGIDALEVETGVSAAARETTRALGEMATDGEASLAVLAAAGRAATESLNADELEHFRIELQALEGAGKISAEQLEALTLHIDMLTDGGNEATDQMRELQAAIAEVGSQHELGQIAAEIDRLGQAGELSADQVEQLTAAIQEQRKALADAGAAAQKARENQDDFGKSTADSTSEIERQGAEADKTGSRVARMGFSVELTAEAQEKLNQQLQEFNGIGNAAWLVHYRRSLENAVQLTERARQAEEARNAEIARSEQMTEAYARSLERLRHQHDVTGRSGVQSIDDLARANKELRFQLMEVRGEEEQLAELRERERRKDLELQRRAAVEAGDLERMKLLDEQLRLLDQLAQEERHREQASKTTAANKEREAEATEKMADAQERASRATAALPPRREIAVTLSTTGGESGAPQFRQADMSNLANQLLPMILEEIERDKIRG